MNQFFFYIDNIICPSRYTPFRRLFLPHAHCSFKRKVFLVLRADYMTLYESGWFIATLLPHGSLIVI